MTADEVIIETVSEENLPAQIQDAPVVASPI